MYLKPGFPVPISYSPMKTHQCTHLRVPVCFVEFTNSSSVAHTWSGWCAYMRLAYAARQNLSLDVARRTFPSLLMLSYLSFGGQPLFQLAAYNTTGTGARQWPGVGEHRLW